MSYKPLILIGAARSGTKLLRDLVALHPNVDSVPYDVPYIWTKHNEQLGHDQLDPALANEKVRSYIQAALGRFHREGEFLIEKTVGNTLRVPFVQSVFPDAKLLVLRRHGIDVVESVWRMWQAPPDPGYILKKLRTFPIHEAFGYGVRYAGTMFSKVVLGKKDAGIWGVRYPGVENDLKNHSLLEVCAIQWVKCIEESENALASVPEDRKVVVRYEDLVERPEVEIRRVCEFAGIDYAPFEGGLLEGKVQKGSVGKGASKLKPEELASILPIITPAMQRLGYALPGESEA
jgi:hypothetical protein